MKKQLEKNSKIELLLERVQVSVVSGTRSWSELGVEEEYKKLTARWICLPDIDAFSLLVKNQVNLA